jgi:hypothetical protein
LAFLLGGVIDVLGYTLGSLRARRRASRVR